MIRKIKNYMFTIAFALTLGAPILAPAAVTYAACSGTSSSIASGANSALGSDQTGNGIDCSDTGTSGISGIAANIVNVFSIIVGVVSVIMIIYGGFRYITSGGESGSVTNAKNTLVYAIVGLVIVALAQLIVHYVLSQTSGVAQ
jgi:cytochrome bd-type quinol oxidase subunit 2